MNDNDINEMIKKAQSMIQNNQIPEDIKSLINNFQNSNNSSNTNNRNNNNNTYRNNSYNYSSNYNSSTNNMNKSNINLNNQNNNNYNLKNNLNNNNNLNSSSSSNSNSNLNSDSTSTNFNNIDMETLMKIQNIMSKMKNSDNDNMSKLLLSLKPYLRNGKKEKVDEYIQLIKMGKITQFLDLFGGDQK